MINSFLRTRTVVRSKVNLLLAPFLGMLFIAMTAQFIVQMLIDNVGKVQINSLSARRVVIPQLGTSMLQAYHTQSEVRKFPSAALSKLRKGERVAHFSFS